MSGVTPTQRGELVRDALACLLADHPNTPEAENVWRPASAVSRTADFGQRRRFFLRELATVAETYLRLFAPVRDWEHRDREELGRLVWEAENSEVVFADRILVGRREAPVWSARTRGVPRRILKAGKAAYGDRFAGVRLLAAGAPGKSLLVGSLNETPRLLVETPLWFAAPVIEGASISKMAAGGAK